MRKTVAKSLRKRAAYLALSKGKPELSAKIYKRMKQAWNALPRPLRRAANVRV